MEESIKTIKIVTIISIISFIIAWFMGSELLKDYSQSYIFGVSWGTLQNTAFGIFGSAALTAIYAWLIYSVQKEKYLIDFESYLINACVSAKKAFIQIQEASKILENGILSKEAEPTFVGINTIIEGIGTQQQKIQPKSISFLRNYGLVVSFNVLLCDCHESARLLIAEHHNLKIKYERWKICNNTKRLAQLETDSNSQLLDEAKSCSEEDLRLSVNKLSWRLSDLITRSSLVIQKLYLLQKKQDQLQSIGQRIDEEARYFQKNIDVEVPVVDKKTIAEHQIKVIKSVSAIEGLLSYANGPAIAILGENPYLYANELMRMLRILRGSQLEVSILYESDKKLNFDIGRIVELFEGLVRNLQVTISLSVSLKAEFINRLTSQGIDPNTVYRNDPKLVELTVEFLREKTPYRMIESSIDEILKIIRSDDFKSRLNFGGYKGASDEK